METPRLFELKPDRAVKPWQGGPLPDPSTPRPAPAHVPGRDTEVEAAGLAAQAAGLAAQAAGLAAQAAGLAAQAAGRWRDPVLEAIATAGEAGVTDWELQERVGGALYTVTPRRAELLRMGWVVDSGRRRGTSTGRSAIVWVLSDAGRAQFDLREGP